MSHPDPTLPPAEPPAASRISDRAALEAALAGAAGLLLGRLFLGRGAGFLAGTAAIAARLIADAAAKKLSEDPRETKVTPPVPPIAPLSTTPAPTATSFANLTPDTGPAPSVAVPAAARIFSFDGQSEAVEVVEVGDVPESSTAKEAGPDTLPADAPLSETTETTPYMEEIFPDRVPLPVQEPFANLFREALPLPAVADPSAKVSDAGGSERVLPTTPPVAEHSAAAAEPATLDSLPAFPVIAEATPGQTEGSLPAPSVDPALPDLPPFPEYATDPPHPDEIWKMAAEESAPIAPPTSPGTPFHIQATTPIPDYPSIAAPAHPASPLPLFEAGHENPFAVLLRPAPPDPVAPETIDAPVPPREDETPLVFPDASPVRTPAGIIPVFEPRAFDDPLPNPLVEPVPVASEMMTPGVAATPLPEPAPLPIISLKARPTPPTSKSEAPEVLPPLHIPAELGSRVITAPPEVLSPDPQVVPEPTAPRRASKAWVMLLLLVAALLTWIYRHELKKMAADTFPPRDATQLPAPAQPPASPVITPSSSPAFPAPRLVTPAPSSPPPKLPEATSSDQKAAMIRPLVPAPAPGALVPAITDPVVFAEPLPGVPQDFPPDSLEGQARQTLEKLLTASALPEIAPLVHDPAASLKQAAKWFPDGNPQPIPWKRIIFDSSDQMPRSTYKAILFRVVTDHTPLGFPVAVEETRHGPRIDFTAFVQCRDRLLDAFISKPDASPQSFLVLMRRGHYFGEELSAAELEPLICFEIAAPNPGSPKHRVFIQRGSDLGRRAVRQFVWDKSYTPVVELTRVGKHIEITAIVRDVWRVPGA